MSTPHICFGPDLSPAPGELHYWYSVLGEQGERLALMYLGTSGNYHANGEQWLPGMASLSEQGRMLRAVIQDNLPEPSSSEEIIVALAEAEPVS